MKRYSLCITFTSTAYATKDTTIIHHIYKLDFAVWVPFSTTIKSAALFDLVFFQVNALLRVWILTRQRRIAPGTGLGYSSLSRRIATDDDNLCFTATFMRKVG